MRSEGSAVSRASARVSGSARPRSSGDISIAWARCTWKRSWTPSAATSSVGSPPVISRRLRLCCCTIACAAVLSGEGDRRFGPAHRRWARVLRARGPSRRAVLGLERHRALPYRGAAPTDRWPRRAVQQNYAREVLPGSLPRDVRRERGGAIAAPQSPVPPLQYERLHQGYRNQGRQLTETVELYLKAVLETA